MEGIRTEEAKAAPPLDYYIKKAHSLSGVIPVGAFLVEHIWTNSQAISGPEHFDKAVENLQGLPILIFLEIGFIWLPLAFHALLGIYITLAGRVNIVRYPHGANFSYLLQRISGFVILPFLAYHIYEFRFNPDGKVVTFARSAELLASTGVKLAYVVFLLAVCYHFFNGLWNFLCKWGITTGIRAQQRMAAVLAACGILFFAYSVWTLVQFHVPAAPTGLAASAGPMGKVNLVWVDNSDDEMGFKIEKSESADTGFAEYATVAANTTSYITDLAEERTYYFRVRAYTSDRMSRYSNVAAVKTSKKDGSNER